MEKYKVIYADPPWAYPESGSNAKVHNRHYPCQDLEWIKALPVGQISHSSALLFLWATCPRLKDAFDVIESWGFLYKTVAFVWVKANKRVKGGESDVLPFDDFMGGGAWTRSNAEICLLGTRGRPERQSRSVRQVIYSPVQRHSEKPGIVREKILALCGDVTRIELFARGHTDGWDVWGDEVESSIPVLGSFNQGGSREPI